MYVFWLNHRFRMTSSTSYSVSSTIYQTPCITITTYSNRCGTTTCMSLRREICHKCHKQLSKAR
ncbi:hypothetical protein ABEB36_011678 [Hypothenemus hampei]|uniref:Uncharacterized protein n=1 Tax=Hypothenemus hampei TaxID=57062 RepID=A0ABD1E8M6_HYPHA